MGIMKDLLTCCMYDEPVIWKTITAKNIKTCNPGPLRNHTLSCYKSNLILIGGQKNVVDNNNQIYRYDLFSQSWSVCKCLSSEGKPFNFAFDSHCAIIHSSYFLIQKAIFTLSEDTKRIQLFTPPKLLKFHLKKYQRTS